MNKIIKNFLWLIFAFLLLPSLGFAVGKNSMPPKSTLTVHVTGIESNQGTIRVALYNSQAAYEYKQDPAQYIYQKAHSGITNQQATVVFTNIPYGEYAIKLFHDRDNSGVFKKNFIGLPLEGIGFSDNPKLNHKAPSFDQTKFSVNQPKVSINIKMINP